MPPRLLIPRSATASRLAVSARGVASLAGRSPGLARTFKVTGSPAVLSRAVRGLRRN